MVEFYITYEPIINQRLVLAIVGYQQLIVQPWVYLLKKTHILF